MLFSISDLLYPARDATVQFSYSMTLINQIYFLEITFQCQFCPPFFISNFRNFHLSMDNPGVSAFVAYRIFETLMNRYLSLIFIISESMTTEEKVLAYNSANRAVAILCNHQRTVPKTYFKSMKNLEKKVSFKSIFTVHLLFLLRLLLYPSEHLLFLSNFKLF